MTRDVLGRKNFTNLGGGPKKQPEKRKSAEVLKSTMTVMK